MLLPISPYQIDPSLVSVASRIALAGDLIIFPTDTIYGIGTSAMSQAGIMRLFSVKHRPMTQPVGVFVDSFEMLSTICSISDNLSAFLFSLWPSPVTCILPRKKDVQIFTTPTKTQLGTVGVRMPKNPIIKKLVAAMNVPLLETSINVSTQPFLRREELLGGYARFAQVMIDGGPEPDDSPSTIIDLSKPKAVCLRQGSVSCLLLREKLAQSGIEWDENQALPA